jgi:hypothetical protein
MSTRRPRAPFRRSLRPSTHGSTSAVAQAIKTRLWALSGGPERIRWRLGRSVSVSDREIKALRLARYRRRHRRTAAPVHQRCRRDRLARRRRRKQRPGATNASGLAAAGTTGGGGAPGHRQPRRDPADPAEHGPYIGAGRAGALLMESNDLRVWSYLCPGDRWLAGRATDNTAVAGDVNGRTSGTGMGGSGCLGLGRRRSTILALIEETLAAMLAPEIFSSELSASKVRMPQATPYRLAPHRPSTPGISPAAAQRLLATLPPSARSAAIARLQGLAPTSPNARFLATQIGLAATPELLATPRLLAGISAIIIAVLSPSNLDTMPEKADAPIPRASETTAPIVVKIVLSRRPAPAAPEINPAPLPPDLSTTEQHSAAAGLFLLI